MNHFFPVHARRGRDSRVRFPVTWRMAAGLGLLLAVDVQAHDPGLSSLAVSQRPAGLQAVLSLARADAGILLPLPEHLDGRESLREFERNHRGWEAQVAAFLRVNVAGLELHPAGLQLDLETGNTFQVRFEYALPTAARGGAEVEIRSQTLERLPRGHRQYLTFLDSGGAVRASRMLDAAQPGFGIALDSPAARVTGDRSPGEFLWMGIEHIATGYDHLAFLLGLLIVASPMRAVAKLITSFTVAHSITLALATLDVIHLPALVVEPLIALSIVYVGIENLRGGALEGRWRLTFVFGLVHGCGFASALRDAGVGSGGSGVALPLICFNLGVELGQLALAAVVLPGLWLLGRRASFQLRYVPVCSVLIALAGGYWLAERLAPAVCR